MSAGSHERAAKASRYGSYAVVSELGRGGMASVYEARHVELGKRAAIKVMFPSLAASPTAAARFLREARAVAQLRHPHIVDVFDVGTQDDIPFFVMELLEGSTLAMWLAERGPLAPEQIAGLFLPVLSAVAAAHQSGLIHRDLKPANVFLAHRSGPLVHPMVLDFGISKVVTDTEDASLTRSESLIGTVHYMSPEQTRGGSTATALSDQYAIGVMLYECATGKRPFGGASHYELMHAIVTAPVVPPSQVDPKLPPEFDELVLRAMSRDPERRYPSVHALGNALLSFADKVGWALWGHEFAGNASLDEAKGTADAALTTDPDFPAARGLSSSSASGRVSRAASGRGPSKWWPWVTGCLAAYALVATAWLAWPGRASRSPAEVIAPPADSASLPRAATKPLPSAAATSAVVAAPDPSPSGVAVPPGVGRPVLGVAVAPTSAVADKPSPSSRPARVTKVKPAPKGATSSQPSPPSELGTNSALIVD